MAFKTVAKNLRPRDREAAIGGPERRYRHAARSERLHPSAVRPEPRPACTAKREDGCARIDSAFSIGRLKQKLPIVVPAGPAVAQCELHAHRIKPPEPCTQQRRGLERRWKNPAAGADEGWLPQRLAPCAQPSWRERLDHSCKPRLRFAVARQKFRQRFAVRQIEAATSRHQKFAAGRRHCIIDRDAGSASRQHLGRHQPGRTGADDGDLSLSRRHRAM